MRGLHQWQSEAILMQSEVILREAIIGHLMREAI